MVEGNFEFYCTERLQNEEFLLFVKELLSPSLRKNFDFNFLKCPERITELEKVLGFM